MCVCQGKKITCPGVKFQSGQAYILCVCTYIYTYICV